MQSKKRNRGFTLIELLIVVAIIAILAAIAVPNFLEAQTRAKITRTIADMRTIATAMETYRVDHNWIPWRGDDFAANNYHGTLEFLRWKDKATDEEFGIGHMLTSPIAYITSVPIDIFNTRAFKNERPHNFDFQVEWAAAFMRGASKEVVSKGSNISSFVWPNDSRNGVIHYTYVLQSCGPDLSFWDGSNQDIYYDPTNGTVSGGDIYYIDTLGMRGDGKN